VIFYESAAEVADMVETCKFHSPWLSMHFLDMDLYAELLTYATGTKINGPELLKAGERAYNVERAFIVREGVRRENDYPPWREFEEPYPSGPFKGAVLNREKYNVLLDEYYTLHGWDVKTGIPTKKKLKELGLADVAENLDKCGVYRDTRKKVGE